MTYLELVNEVLADAFPEDIAPNLDTIYRKRVLDGLIELQHLVKELRVRQWTFFEHGGTYYRQGMTSITKPAGQIKNVCVFNSRTLRDVIYYTPATRQDFDNLITFRAAQMDYPEDVPYPLTGYFEPTSSLDRGFRANEGKYCVDRNEILIAPAIESYERILVEWSGSKTSYTNDDLVDFGKYERQVKAALILWLRKEAARFEERSQSDFIAMSQGWRDAVSTLMIDAKEDTEIELPIEDNVHALTLGVTTSEEVVPVTSIGATITDPVWLNRLWMLCVDNDKLYNLGALLVDGTIVTDVAGNGVDYSAAEVTFEAIRADDIRVKADDDSFYQLTITLDGETPVPGYVQTPLSGEDETVLDDISTIYVDVLCPDNNTYYRLRLALVDGVVTLVVGTAPDEVTYPPITEQDDIIGVLRMRDAVTGNVIYIRVKDGQISLKDS